MKRLFSLWTLLCVFFQLWAQAPAGYYESATGSKGAGLKTALFQIITNPSVTSYNGLWNSFTRTDVREDGKVWDMYSSTTDFRFINDQCGNYSGEGSCYNREHSFPKSWFGGEVSPMYSDLFHLCPTDGYVNNRRGNHPFGETNGEDYKSDEGFSKLGKSTTTGYSGTVFEPNDEYKGDFARTYFYMATCYEDRIANWNSDMLAHNSYPAYAQWAIDMLLRWAAEDPVSPKEVTRNNEVYKIQKNRNPYIDYPGLEQYVWGSKTDVAFDPDNYDGGEVPPVEKDVEDPVFTPSQGAVTEGTMVEISTTTPNAYIVYTLNGGSQQTNESPVYVEITEPTDIEAYAFVGDKESSTVTASYTIMNTVPDEGMQTFRKVTSTAELKSGYRYLVVCEDEATAMGAISKSIRDDCNITISNDQINTKVDSEGLPYQVTLGGSEGAYTLYDATAQTYLSLAADKNILNSSTVADSENALWTISISDGLATIQNNAYTNRSIQYNANPSHSRFACYSYKSGQKPVSLYVNVKGSSISQIVYKADEPVDVYTLTGILVRKGIRADQALQGLQGIYLIKGQQTNRTQKVIAR